MPTSAAPEESMCKLCSDSLASICTTDGKILESWCKPEAEAVAWWIWPITLKQTSEAKERKEHSRSPLPVLNELNVCYETNS